MQQAIVITETCHPSDISLCRIQKMQLTNNSLSLPSQIDPFPSLHRSRFWCKVTHPLTFSHSSGKFLASTLKASLHTCEPCRTGCQKMAESQVLNHLMTFCFNPKIFVMSKNILNLIWTLWHFHRHLF